jgi:hypothetical protein
MTTIGLLDGKVTVEQIEKAVRERLKAKDIKFLNDTSGSYVKMMFTFSGEMRILSIYPGTDDVNSYKFLEEGTERITRIELDYWGSSVKIIRELVYEFAGWMIPSSDHRGKMKVCTPSPADENSSMRERNISFDDIEGKLSLKVSEGMTETIFNTMVESMPTILDSHNRDIKVFLEYLWNEKLSDDFKKLKIGKMKFAQHASKWDLNLDVKDELL